MSRKPSLREEWFVEDAIAALNGGPMPAEHAAFGATPEVAYSQIYQMSRAIRVEHITADRFDAAKAISDWAVVEMFG